MKDKITPDYDHLIGLVYEGPLQEKPWQGFLPALRQFFDAQVVSLVLRPPAIGDRGVILNCRRGDDGGLQEGLADPDDWEAIHYREHFFAIDPFVNLPPGKVVTQRELVPDEELLESEYYRNYLQPIGLFHILGVDTIAPDGTLARLRIARRPSENAFTEEDKTSCQKLLPHLRRAIQIHARLSRTESERDIYAGAVDQLSMATVILDEWGQVLATNSVAKVLLEEGDGICTINRELQLTDRQSNGRLRELIAEATSDQRAGTTGMARALRVSRPSGKSDLGLVIRPVPASERAEGQSSPCITVFISDPEHQESTSQQVLGELFGLTPAEANLAIKLTRGMSLAQLSGEQNISQHTARAQLKAVFAKTGATRQAELVRLVLKSVAILG
jgi:DNA-binding CsgD family transcriptional regulator